MKRVFSFSLHNSTPLTSESPISRIDDRLRCLELQQTRLGLRQPQQKFHSIVLFRATTCISQQDGSGSSCLDLRTILIRDRLQFHMIHAGAMVVHGDRMRIVNGEWGMTKQT